MQLRTENATAFDITVGDAVLTVCPLAASALSRLRQKYTKIVRGVEQVDGVALTREMFDRVVVGFKKNLTDNNGKALVCDTETKAAICEHNGGFVGEVLAEIESVEAARRAGELGNSKPGASGTSSQAK